MKKIMAGMLSACIAISPLTAISFAKAAEVKLISSYETEEAQSMEIVLLKVKSKMSIPTELTEFNYRLNYSSGNYSKSRYWNFEWRDKENNKNMTIRADDDGNILSYSTYERNRESSKPTYLKDELLKNATDFIDKILPALSDNIVLRECEFSGVYSGTYLYTFERIENGIKIPDNTLSVSVDYETGEVRSFNSNWVFDVEIPSPEVNFTIEEAKEKLGKEVKMNLKYMSKTELINDKRIAKAYLVYVPDKSYVALDAKTGKIYDTHDEFYSMNDTAQKEMLNASPSFGANEESGLTEEEIAKINELNNLITKEDAILSVTSKKEVLHLDDSAKAVSARLSKQYNFDEDSGYVWNLSFSDPRDVDYNSDDTYRAYANATIDAKTGKILAFNSSVRSYYDSKNKKWENVNVKYSSEECKNVFEKFVKELESEKFENTKLSNSTDRAYLLKYINEEPVYGGYSYNYSRVNEGIEYTYNSINGKVDGVTGKIYAYNVNWTDDIEFESPRDAMTPEEAYKAYSQKDGFELVYEINNKHYIEEELEENKYYDYSELYHLEKEVRLVYRTNINPSNISPFSGEQLDYAGEVYENVNEKEYTDISGYWGERKVRLITDMGYTFEGNKFLPDNLITKEEWRELLNLVGSYINEEEYKKIEKVTKLDAMKTIINNLGLEKVAKLSTIYKSSFSDINQVDDKDIGYIALAEGLGIITGDINNKCNANKELTRIEAICIALNLANVR